MQVWVSGLVVFCVFGGGLCAEVGRQAAMCQNGGEQGCHEDSTAAIAVRADSQHSFCTEGSQFLISGT